MKRVGIIDSRVSVGLAMALEGLAKSHTAADLTTTTEQQPETKEPTNRNERRALEREQRKLKGKA